jgi:acyl-CoA thioesterase II
MTYQPPTLADIVAALQVEPSGDGLFVAAQLDNPAHHIAGGHLAGQALVAAGRTAPGRTPHSAHVYFLRPGDARESVEIEVVNQRDGGAFSTRQVTARQRGDVLLETLVSLSEPIDGREYQEQMPTAPEPESLLSAQEQLAVYADEYRGHWVRPQPFERRYIDPPPRLAVESAERSSRLRMWWRPVESVPDDPTLRCGLLAYVVGTTMLEAAMIMHGITPVSGFSALVDQAIWFHRPPDLDDWILCDQRSPSGISGRGMGSGAMYNRSGQLVCTATNEVYFGRNTR